MVDTAEPIPGKSPAEEVTTSAMGLKKIKEEKPTPPKKVEPKVDLGNEKQPDSEASVDDLFQARNVEALLKRKDDPQAQLAAIVLMSNGYRSFNVRNEGCIGWIETVGAEVIAGSLSLDADSQEMVSAKRQQLLDTHKRYQAAHKQREDLILDVRYAHGDRKEQLQKQLKAVNAQENEIEAQMDGFYRELMLPVRKAVLSSEELPEAHKLNIIEGIKGYGAVLEAEDELLKQTYASTKSEAIKRQIADTVMFNMGHDLNSFDVVPVDDLEGLDVDIDKLFIATLGNKDTTGEFVETRVASVFFPDKDPAKIRRCWEALRKVTGLESSYSETSFASDGYNHDTKLMNIEYFGNFVESADDLIPVVEMLSAYRFRYIPGEHLEGKLYPQYIERLKDLGGDLETLRKELESIKAVVPDFKYRYVVDSRYPPTKTERELYLEDNPFSITLKQGIYPRSVESDDKFREAVAYFNKLHQIVPERWRGGFLQTYIEMMSRAAGYSDRPLAVTRKAITEASKYIFDPSLTPKQIELFATDFFESSLDPRNENAKTAMDFCEKYADKIRVWIDGKKHVDADASWYQFSLLAADLYRYPFIEGEEDTAISKMQQDLIYARGAIPRIKDPELRDKAALNLVFALTDEEVGDLQSARLFVDMMNDGVLKNEAQEEIRLEVERSERGEVTTWKKMEKVRRNSAHNVEFLKDLFGYGSQEGLQKAQEEYREAFKTSPDVYATFSLERQAKLKEEIQRIREDFTVAVNITWANVLKSLEAGRVISIWENPEVMELRNKYGKYNYEQRRDEIERMVGNRSKGGMRDPHPIYAAAASPNNRDEHYGGTGGGYGECFFVLKTDRIRERTSFCYDDSFNGYNRWLVDWEGGVVAKAIHNLNDSRSRHGYVEAQILGGVALDDIESINIPSDAIYEENQYGWSAGTDVLEKIDQLREQYPGIKINIIEVAKT